MIADMLERRSVTTRLAAFEHGDRAFLLAAGGAGLVAVQFAPNMIRIVVGFALAFTVPGLALLSMAFREESDQTAHLRGAHRLGLVVMLSCAAHVALALTVYALGLAMSRMTVMVSLSVLIYFAALHAFWPILRGVQMNAHHDIADHSPIGALVPDNDNAAYVRAAENGRQWSSRWPSVVGLVLAVSVGAIVILMALKILPAPPETPFATLSLSGPWAGIDHATSVDKNGDVAIQLTLTNNSLDTETYTIVSSAGDISWRPRNFTLEGGAKWEGIVAGQVGVHQCLTRILIGVNGVPKDATRTATDGSKTVNPLIVWAGPQNVLPCAGPFSKEQDIIKFKRQDAFVSTTSTQPTQQGAQG